MTTRFSTLASFYAGDARRLSSPELDLGLLWREQRGGSTFRAAWIRDTGELYLVRHGDPDAGGGDVEVLACFPGDAELDAAVRGFAHVCGLVGSVGWLRSRTARIGVAA